MFKFKQIPPNFIFNGIDGISGTESYILKTLSKYMNFTVNLVNCHLNFSFLFGKLIKNVRIYWNKYLLLKTKRPVSSKGGGLCLIWHLCETYENRVLHSTLYHKRRNVYDTRPSDKGQNAVPIGTIRIQDMDHIVHHN